MSDDHKVNGEMDEAALDRSIEESVAAVRAGQSLAGQTAGTGSTGEAGPTGDSAPTGETGATGEAQAGETSATGATGEAEIRIPNKGKFESDEAYEKRIELFDLVKKRKAATTPEAKEALAAEIARAKGDLKILGAAERFTKTKTDGAPTGATGQTGEADPLLAADHERAKSLGLVTKEEVEAAIAQTQHDAAVRSDIGKFVERHPEFKDPDVLDVFFGFVDNNYAWQGKSGKDLTALLEMAHENMFRPAETVQERVLKAAGVADRVNAMQFPGGTTGAKITHSPDMQQSIDELKATGMSEEKAIELLSD